MERANVVMKRVVGALAGVVLFCGGVVAAPPRVVSSTVEDGQDDVDPALTEIRVAFDQAMDPRSWSIVGGGPSFPEITQKPRWADEKTIVIAVKLKPEHEYRMSLNSDTFTGFRNVKGEAALWRPLAFRTRPRNGGNPADPLSVEANRAAIAKLRKAIDEDYSYRDRMKIDWEKAFAEHGPAMEGAKTANEFARAVARLLRPAEDGHVYVKAGERTIGTHANSKPPNYHFQTLRKVVSDWREHGNVVSGKLSGDGGDVGYLAIGGWNAAGVKGLDEAFAAVKDCKGLIIDVRMNGGGDELLAREFAGRFIDEPKVYSRNRNRRGGEWLGPFDRVVEPRPESERYSGPVAVLIGPKVGSSCESFVLMMGEGEQCKLVGEATKGSSGNPKPHDLGNAVTVFLPSWEDRLPDGTVLEGRGVEPDVEVKTTLGELRERDRVLEAGVEAVRSLRRCGQTEALSSLTVFNWRGRRE